MTKYLFLGLSTTGVDEEDNGIYELNYIIESIKRTVGTIHIDTSKDYEVSEFVADAWKKEGYKVPADAIEPFHAATLFVNVLEKIVDRFDSKDRIHLVGFNVSFDERFLRAFIKLAGKSFNSYFWPNTIDLMSVSSFLFRDKRENFTNYKLSTIAYMCDVEYKPTIHSMNKAETIEKIFLSFVDYIE
jgi:DNA polymerase III alpha subunit (gram-positive type)